MENRFAEELYSESLLLSRSELTPSARNQQNNSNDSDGYDLSHEDGSLSDGLVEELDKSSELDREWQRRHDQFHAFGYRDGIAAGKEASSQEGFNIGFKQSVLAGYRWGLVRGVTSAFAYLPEELKEKLVEAHDKRNELQRFYESVHLLSTNDALKSFHEDFMVKGTSEPGKNVEMVQNKTDLQEQTSDCSQLGSYLGQLRSLIPENSAIEMHLPEPK
ncbi:uncharacterized protein LOC114759492 [Neltuma alba]|uniref:uncharacterized protein LOC114759492 n=1 Tax=Neltuma alba TaxID=207710 RepID=UPI0010A47D0A|nr:uncharacterized protein LOC114759492 [Prosopis alba]